MFKRANKITALLVAAASVMSVVPAMAADYKKVDSQDGTIYNAIAFADGKAYVDGEINDQDDATYYLADGKYTALEDVDSGDTVSKYLDYVDVDGDYSINMEDGTVDDNNIKEDNEDDVASALRKNIKDDTEKRYATTDTDDNKTEAEIAKLSGGTGDPYYSTTFLKGEDTSNGGAASYTVYTDKDGNYIDADYNLGKIKVTTTTDGSVDVKNTDDKYDLNSTANANSVYAKVTGAVTVGYDKDYVYRIATVTVYSDNVDIAEINGQAIGVTADGTTVFSDANKRQISYKVLQKISKEADSSDIGGANFAKTVTTYTLSTDKGLALDGIADVDLADTATGNYFVSNGKVTKYTTTITAGAGKVAARTYSLKSSNGFYYTDEEAKTSEDVEVSDDNVAAVTVSGGALYRLDGGYIYKYNNIDDYDKLYKVDGAFDEFSVANDDNIIAWNEKDEIYSIIGAQKATDETTTDTTTTTTVPKSGWAQAADLTWSFVNANGTKATGWFQDATGTWYYAKADGIMVANGWALYGSTWYYLGASGAMATNSWIQYGNDWYYVGATGAMLTNTTVGGYVLGASGAWVR